MSDEYMVKGSSLRSRFDFVRERFGEAAEVRLRRPLAGEPGPFTTDPDSARFELQWS